MTHAPIESRPAADGGAAAHVHLKVVPGASRAAIAGVYGERLKVRVTAPAESGKANKAVLRLLAGALDVPVQALEILRGASSPLKTVAVEGITAAEVEQRLLA